MRKKRTIALLVIIVLVALAVPLMAIFTVGKARADAAEEMQCISLWQIDGFEGGRGSRANYLKTAGEKCFKKRKTYLNVVTLSADAARENLAQGVLPDIISYPAGIYGIENYINSRDYIYKTWCRGGYCLLSLRENCDFSDVSAANTVINGGKDNLSEVAAALCGLHGARTEMTTNAYLQLIGGKFDYLLGTQRDVFRLKTRGVSFSLKPVEEFNDLYQNISIVASGKKYRECLEFIDYLLSESHVGDLGLFYGDNTACEEALNPMIGVDFSYKLNYPCGEEYITQLKSAAQNGDVNKIKTLLK